jgi:glycosyltransferase involved in cell wall biosynthesis
MFFNPVRYSIVIPSLNGYKTLSKTLPMMLSIDRNDIQWVISDNRSDDDLFDYVSGLNDRRITLIRPEKRLQVGAHLDFAYQHATGAWQGHLGDDDLTLLSRFDILDEIISNNPNVDLIKGEFARYYWHDFPVREMANRLSPAKFFTGSVSIHDGKTYAEKLLNTIGIYGGGSWVVKKEVVDKIRKDLGYFSPFHSVEFFSMRASSLFSKEVAEVDLPIWIMGRHAGSVGSQALMSEDKVKSSDWDWSFEDPDDHKHCPYQYKGAVPISLDAALQIVEEFPKEFNLGSIDKKYWAKLVLIETERLIKDKKLPPSYRRERDVLIKSEFNFTLFLLYSNVYRIYYSLPDFFSKLYVRYRSRSLTPKNYCFGWKDLESLEELYMKNDIMGLAEVLDKENFKCIPKLKLNYMI